MRRIPRFLPPLVGAVLALVLGFGGGLLGSRFSPSAPSAGAAGAPVTIDAAPAPEIPVEVLPTDAAGLQALVAEAEAAAGASPVTVPVVIGGSPSSETAAVDRLLDEVSVAADPEGTAGAPGVFTLAPVVDPCLDVPTEACPEGIETTVLGIDRRPPLRILRVGAATTAPGGVGAHCVGSDGIALVVVTNQPVWVEATYFGEAGTGRADGRTTDEAVTYWQEQREGKDPRDVSWPTVTTCLYPTDVVAGAVYDAHVGVTVDDGGPEPDRGAESAYARFSFHGDGAATRPATRIFTAGAGDVVVASVPHRPGETVTVEPVEFAGAEDRGCVVDAVPDPNHVRPLSTPRVAEVSADDLLARNELPDLTRLTTVAFALNEGLTVRFCVTVTREDGDDDYRASAVVRTADRLVPVITLHSVFAATDVKDVILQGYLGNGRTCGRFVVRSRTESLFPNGQPFCDLRSSAGTQGAAWPADQPLPISGSVLDTFTVTLDDDLEDDAATALTIDLASLGRCYSRCVPPPDSYHSLYWTSGGSTPERAWLVARVHWEQGSANGSFTSTVSQFAEVDPAGPVIALAPPEHLTLDTATAVLQQTSYDAATRSGTATVDLRADELGTYDARLIPTPGTGTLCTRPDAVIQRSGVLGAPTSRDWLEPVRVQFTGLCAGADYSLIVKLIALDGRVSVWGTDRFVAGAPRDSFIGGGWAGARLHTPEVERRLEVSYEIYDHRIDPEGRRPFFLSADMDGAALIGPRSYGCFSPTSPIAFGRPFTQTFLVGEQLHLSGRLELSALSECQTGGTFRLSPVHLPVGWQAELDLGRIDGNPDGVRIVVDPEPTTDTELLDDASRMGLRVIIRWVDAPRT